MKKKIVFFIVFFLFLPIPSLALVKGNLEINLIEQENVGVKYTPECLFECHLPLKIKWLGSDTILQKSELKTYKNKIEGIDDIYKIDIKYLKNETYFKNERKSNCSTHVEYTSNMTQYYVEKCYPYDIQIEKWKLTWNNLPSNITLKSNKEYYIDIIGYREPKGFSAIDIVPEIKGILFSELAWWNNSWNYAKEINIWSITGFCNANTQVEINITNLTNMQDDCDDARFTLDNITELDYWRESYSASNWCNFWIKIPPTINSSTNTTIWFYFNNSNVSTTSNGKTTFIIFDDFSGGSVNWSTWDSGDTAKYSISGGWLRLSAIDSGQLESDHIHTQENFTDKKVAHFLWKDDSTVSNNDRIGFYKTQDGSWSEYLDALISNTKTRIYYLKSTGGYNDSEVLPVLTGNTVYEIEIYLDAYNNNFSYYLNNSLLTSANNLANNSTFWFGDLCQDGTFVYWDNFRIREYCISGVQYHIGEPIPRIIPPSNYTEFISYFCSNNHSVYNLTYLNSSGGYQSNFTYTNCDFGCDNVTNTCNLPTYQTNIIFFSAICIIIFIGWKVIKRL